MERLKTIKNQLISEVQTQMSDLKCVDAKELGEVIDMIKDIAQTEYYCEIYKQMKESGEVPKESHSYYYTERYMPVYRDMETPKMSYKPDAWTGYEEEPYYDKDFILSHMRDEREGRSPAKRKMYMESKMSGADTNKSMKELESYMQDLTSDMMDLLDKASPEEKSIVQKKINTLAAKIQNV